MNKIIGLILTFCIFSCNKSESVEPVKPAVLNFKAQYSENIWGHCSPNLTSYIDSSNNNLCYIATSCYGISVFCMSQVVK